MAYLLFNDSINFPLSPASQKQTKRKKKKKIREHMFAVRIIKVKVKMWFS